VPFLFRRFFRGLFKRLYDFLYREYNPVHGRWISPDPAGLAAVDPTNPQSWNRYAYVNNTPLMTTDEDALWGGCFFWCAGDLTFDGSVLSEFSIPSLPQFTILPGENSLNWPAPYPLIDRIEDILSGNWGRALGLDSRCETEFGAPCADFIGTGRRVSREEAAYNAYLTARLFPPLLDFTDPGPPRLRRAKIDCRTGHCFSAIHDVIRSYPSNLEVWQWCEIATALSMGGGTGVAPSTEDLEPVGQRGTQMDRNYRQYNPLGQNLGNAAGNAAAFLGTYSACAGSWLR
jgi:RHS repeat-associated protein